MADISKLKVAGTVLNIKDAVARQEIADARPLDFAGAFNIEYGVEGTKVELNALTEDDLDSILT